MMFYFCSVMTAQPHPSQFETPPDPEARAARRIAMAHRLAERAMELAEAAQRLALARMEREIAALEAGETAEDAAPASRRSDPVAAAERMARMVRLSLALAARLDGDEPVRRERVRADERAGRQEEKEARSREIDARWDSVMAEKERRRELVVEVAAQALEQIGAEEDEVLERVEEFYERLHEGEREFDVSQRSVGAVVASLCKAMEIEPDWSVWAEEDWAVEEAATNARGSPYARSGVAAVKAGGDTADAPPEEPVCEPVAAHGSSP